jgi:NPCBM/NEW2 domain
VAKAPLNGEQASGDGRALTIRGAQFAKGLGVHASSEVVYKLGGQCSAFMAEIGLDDEIAPGGSVVFQVWNSGLKIYDSGVMTGSMPRKTINVDISGTDTLRLVVTNGGDDINSDHADWAAPQVVCSSTAVLP